MFIDEIIQRGTQVNPTSLARIRAKNGERNLLYLHLRS
jgi:hypothetical protein